MKQSEYMTSQKKQLLSFLSENKDRHFTIEEIAEKMAESGHAPGKSTLYRQMSRLLEAGTVRRFEVADSKSFVYQYTQDTDSCSDHFHLKCIKCGKFIHMECPMMTELQEHVLSEHGFAIGAGKSVIYGECAACLKKEKENK